ncbi:hypothetical protein C3L33_00796, partial [Rhododendron williamsianum]
MEEAKEVSKSDEPKYRGVKAMPFVIGDACTDTHSSNLKPPPSLLWHYRHMRCPNSMANGFPTECLRPTSDRRKRHPTVQPGLRSRPVQPQHRVGEEGNHQLLQLVLLHLHVRDDGFPDGDRLRADGQELGLGIGHPDVPHVLVLLLLLRWNEDLRHGDSRGEPLDECAAGFSFRSQEEKGGVAGTAVGLPL